MSFAPDDGPPRDETLYRQCLLCRDAESTYRWLPLEVAKQGLRVRIKNADGAWEDNWLMSIVFQQTACGYELDFARKASRKKK